MINFLSKIRKEKGIKQNQLAKAIGRSPQEISSFEKGKSTLPKDVLLRIANFLGTSLEDIFEDNHSSILDDNTKARLVESVDAAGFYKEYGQKLVLKIAGEVYTLLSTLEALRTDEEKEKFMKALEKKYFVGLAANCLIQKKFNDHEQQHK